LTAPASRERFASLVSAPDESVDLALGALLIAAEEYPQLNADPYLHRLDLLAELVRDRLADETAPLVILQELNRVLFEEEGFRGNTEAYYDPRNSFLNDVLDRRLGIPLTLSIVLLEVGWRLGLALEGINFPGHFLVRFRGEATNLLVDPFQQGDLRFEDQAQTLLDRVYGGAVRLQPEYLQASGRKGMLVRLLANLKNVYLNARDDTRAVAAIERILLVRPDAAEEVRDRGMLLARLGRSDEAVTDLEHYLRSAPEAPDAQRVRLLIDQLGRG
jgi:regulator of sirC expression with transglutaminase-like and TPR domain